MRSAAILVLGVGICLPSVLAQTGRGTDVVNVEANVVCNFEPSIAARNERRLERVAERDSLLQDRKEPKAPLAKKTTATFTTSANCLAAPPGGSFGNGFPAMRDIVTQAWNDAQTLASTATSMAVTDSAFTHYFTGAPQFTNFQAMMTAISSGAWTVNFDCGLTTGDCDGSSAAVTDATVGNGKTITLCTGFFTSASTKFFLPQDGETSVPFRALTGSGWCNSRKPVNFFATAGHTILHELTHLDAVASQTALEPDDDGRHGTIDPQIGCELQGARAYLGVYNADNSKASPDYNAESHAASATEFFFNQQCSMTIN